MAVTRHLKLIAMFAVWTLRAEKDQLNDPYSIETAEGPGESNSYNLEPSAHGRQASSSL
jgi:hypothetical protein